MQRSFATTKPHLVVHQQCHKTVTYQNYMVYYIRSQTLGDLKQQNVKRTTVFIFIQHAKLAVSIFRMFYFL